MTIGNAPEADEYVVARVKEALAQDARLHDLALDVTVRGGRVFVSGHVATPERRAAISDVLADACPGRDVANETTVEEVAAPAGEERLQ